MLGNLHKIKSKIYIECGVSNSRHIKVNVPMTGPFRIPVADIHTKLYLHLSLEHGLSRNRDVSRHWYDYLIDVNTLHKLLG